MEENIKWLIEKGYEYIPSLDEYRFQVYYPNEKYGACTSFKVHEIYDGDLKYIKMLHNNFMKRVERREMF